VAGDTTGGTIDVDVKTKALVDKSAEPAAVTMGQAINITTDMVDASKLAWLTGSYIYIFVYHEGRNIKTTQTGEEKL